MSYTVDSFLGLLEQAHPDSFPAHIKIDVDRIEAKIINGASATLSDPRLRLVLIELNEESDADRAMRRTIEGHGFELASRHTAVPPDADPSPMANCIFRRIT